MWVQIMQRVFALFYASKFLGKFVCNEENVLFSFANLSFNIQIENRHTVQVNESVFERRCIQLDAPKYTVSLILVMHFI